MGSDTFPSIAMLLLRFANNFRILHCFLKHLQPEFSATFPHKPRKISHSFLSLFLLGCTIPVLNVEVSIIGSTHMEGEGTICHTYFLPRTQGCHSHLLVQPVFIIIHHTSSAPNFCFNILSPSRGKQ